MLRDHCTLYNAALQERKDAYKWGGVSVKYAQQAAQLTEIRGEDEQYSGWSAASEQQTLRRLDNAYNAMFTRWNNAGKFSRIRCKSQYRFDTVTFKQGDGGKMFPDARKVYMRGVGHVKIHMHRPLRGDVTQSTITRKSKHTRMGHWYVNVMCKNVPKHIQPSTGKIVGVDKGITHLLADPDAPTGGGGFSGNPRFGKKHEEKLADAQRRFEKRKRGSNRRRKVAALVGLHHRKIANRRREYLHALSRKLVDTYDFIAMEKLKIENMTRFVKRASGTVESPGVNVAAKSGLSKATSDTSLSNSSVLDASWGTLMDMVVYKAEEAGTDIIFVSVRNTSHTCHECGILMWGMVAWGRVVAENRDKERFRCVKCGYADHADTNAARNILRLGLSLRTTVEPATA